MKVLVLNCSAYKHLGFNDLPGTEGDANLWRRFFEHKDGVEAFFFSNPTREDFFRLLDEYQPALVIYSGHGVRVRKGGLYVESLALPGKDTLERVTDAEIVAMYEQHGVSFFLDCCHAAGVLDASRGVLSSSSRSVGDAVPVSARSVGVLSNDDSILSRDLKHESLNYHVSDGARKANTAFAFASALPEEYAWETRLGDQAYGLATLAVLASANLGLKDQNRLRSVMRAYGDDKRQSTPVASDIRVFGNAILF